MGNLHRMEKNKNLFWNALLRRALPLLQRGKGGKKKTLEVLLQLREGKDVQELFFFWTSIKVSTGFGVSPARKKKEE